ncbi:MAG: hypothetical protein ACR2QO_18740 [Acidimicrobiales bacterium]
MSDARITPNPTDEEAAAIVAAVEMLWPRPAGVDDGAERASRSAGWRFSGRWWNRSTPAAARRGRRPRRSP